MGTQLDEHMIEAALGDLDSADLAPAIIMALRLADVLTGSDPIVTPELQAELREHFDDMQILELGSALAISSGWQKFSEAFGIRPDHWTEDMPTPGLATD